jgi:hypothetical protein
MHFVSRILRDMENVMSRIDLSFFDELEEFELASKTPQEPNIRTVYYVPVFNDADACRTKEPSTTDVYSLFHKHLGLFNSWADDEETKALKCLYAADLIFEEAFKSFEVGEPYDELDRQAIVFMEKAYEHEQNANLCRKALERTVIWC